MKALTHASKFMDLSPEDEEEVKKVKVGLYSNVALCYFKMNNVSGRGGLGVQCAVCRSPAMHH